MTEDVEPEDQERRDAAHHHHVVVSEGGPQLVRYQAPGHLETSRG